MAFFRRRAWRRTDGILLRLGWRFAPAWTTQSWLDDVERFGWYSCSRVVLSNADVRVVRYLASSDRWTVLFRGPSAAEALELFQRFRSDPAVAAALERAIRRFTAEGPRAVQHWMLMNLELTGEQIERILEDWGKVIAALAQQEVPLEGGYQKDWRSPAAFLIDGVRAIERHAGFIDESTWHAIARCPAALRCQVGTSTESSWETLGPGGERAEKTTSHVPGYETIDFSRLHELARQHVG